MRTMYSDRSDYDEQVDAVAKALMNDSGGWWAPAEPASASARGAREQWRARGRVALTAIGIEAPPPPKAPPKPKWPTDEQVKMVTGRSPGNAREWLREAITADQVVIAAAIVAHEWHEDGDPQDHNLDTLMDAVYEAGLDYLAEESET